MLLDVKKDWITEHQHADIRRNIVYAPAWRFGQVSDSNITPNYPIWFQNFYDVRRQEFKQEAPQVTKILSDQFMELCPSDYVLIRCMASSNTFGQDGDIHKDWRELGQSITGVVYTDRTWEENWGGETVFYGGEPAIAVTYEPRKLVLFDSAIPHVGKGPQRRCGQQRSILVFQAIGKEYLENISKQIESPK